MVTCMLGGSLKSLLSAVEVAKIKMARGGTDDVVCEFFTCDWGGGGVDRGRERKRENYDAIQLHFPFF